jgi:hypothetical protein
MTDNFEPEKANGLPRGQFEYVFSQMKSIPLYDVSEIKPNAFVIWGVTIVIALAVTFSLIYLAISDLWWGIVIGCIVCGLAIYGKPFFFFNGYRDVWQYYH